MNIINCPKCHESFNIDDADYALILQQVRTEEFKRELDSRVKSECDHISEIKKLEYERILSDKDSQIEKLQFEKDHISEIKKLEAERMIAELKTAHELALKDKDMQIAYYRDMKARMSTKMIGETLEQHCEIEFNRLRATAFKNAYFEKDNDVRTGSKGDYIYRDYDSEGTEIVSIMFEMKNEADATERKHKNEDFFKELDKDRREKNCEYAVLVSMLESDSELYAGITDVSYRYDKMYVIRPQFFIALITLLKNASMNALGYKKALEIERSHDIDIINFERSLDNIKSKFTRDCNLSKKKFDSAIDSIDKAISQLEKTKSALLSSMTYMSTANDKLDDLSIRKLAKNNKTVMNAIDKTLEDPDYE